jgi:hypothetical protein
MKRRKIFNSCYRKSQISLFIVIGLIILISGGILFFVNTINNENIQNYNINSAENVRFYIEACLEQKAKEFLPLIAMQGGYYNLPESKLYYSLNEPNDTLISVLYLIDNKITAVSRERIEQEISQAFKDSALLCTINLSIFPDYINIDVGNDISVESLINQHYLTANLKIPIKVRIGDTLTEISDYHLEINSELYKLYKTAINITNKQYENENKVCLTCFGELENENISIKTSEFENEDHYFIVYYLKNNDSNIKDDSIFQFAHEFQLNDIDSKPSSLRIEEIEELEAYTGYEFSYVVSAIGNDLNFSDDTGLFEIDSKTGLINFTPKNDDAGIHIVTISVKDNNGKIAEEVFRLKVNNFGFSPRIEYIGYLDASVNTPFSYKIKAYSPNSKILIYIDNSDMFNINQNTGIIEFTPDSSQLGVHNFNITVIDNNTNYAVEEGSLLISD